MELAGEGVRLRPYERDHLPALLRLVNDPAVAAWWGTYDEAALHDELTDDRLTVWTIMVDDSPAGVVEAMEELEPDYRHVSLDIFLSAELHGRGLGAEALRTALRHLFAERGHHRATIDPAVENERATRSYARVGFKPVGTVRRAERAPDGRWRDALLMDLLAEELR
ncbi:MAG: GNAT family N-acetyltransferase [Solirubrobacterales bacterium]